MSTSGHRRALRVGLLVVAVVSLLGIAASTQSIAVPDKPAVTMQVAPASQSVERGKAATYTVTMSSRNGFTGNVTLAASGLPSGTTAAFQPPARSLTASGQGSTATATMVLTTSTSTPVGSRSVTVTGTSGKVSGSVTAGLTVNAPASGALSLSATPASVTVEPGAVAVYTVSLARTGVSGGVTLGVTSGLPSGATWSFSPNPTAGNSASLQVSVPSSADDGTHALALRASGTDAGGTTLSSTLGS